VTINGLLPNADRHDRGRAKLPFCECQAIPVSGHAWPARGYYATDSVVFGNFDPAYPNFDGDNPVPAAVRVDPSVDFDWSLGPNGTSSAAPHPSLAAGNGNHFSVQWVGWVQAETTGSYQFVVTSDDGVALWINRNPGNQRIDGGARFLLDPRSHRNEGRWYLSHRSALQAIERTRDGQTGVDST